MLGAVMCITALLAYGKYYKAPKSNNKTTETMETVTPAATILHDDSYSAAETNDLSPQEIEAKLDEIKEKYEDIFISYMFLKRCERANASDYTVIINSLSAEIEPLQSKQEYQGIMFLESVYEAARGSYDAIYSSTECSTDNIAVTLPKYEQFIGDIH